MTVEDRIPSTCPSRREIRSADSPQFICERLVDIFGTTETKNCGVEREICEACCEYPLDSTSQINPVVASVAYARAELAGRELSTDDPQQADILLVKSFSRRWLRCYEEPIPPVSLDQRENTIDKRRAEARANSLPNRNNELRIGLVGPFSRFGLGHQNFDIALHLGVERWLVWGHRSPTPNELPCRIDVFSRPMSPPELEAWMEELDIVIFVESPWLPDLTKVARRLGVKVVCIPNWEWLQPGQPWLEEVDMMLCPTRHTLMMLRSWKSRFRYCWRLEGIDWPIDTQRFKFRQRKVCERFVYVNGSGGVRARRRHGASTEIRRKGMQVLLDAAVMAPRIPVIVYARADDVRSLPSNVELRNLPESNWQLYQEGDVCIQPSYWEGLGLPLLECQSAGMPLITTDHPPMSEHNPFATIPIDGDELVDISSKICITAPRLQPRDVARVMQRTHNTIIGTASRRAREFIETEHSWRVRGPQIRRKLEELMDEPSRFSTVSQFDGSSD